MLDFYAENQNRNYPFASSATLKSDSGVVLPRGLIVDLSMNLDLTYGDRLYVSAITKKGTLCSAVISSVASQLPLATATITEGGVFFQRGVSPQVMLSPVFESAVTGSIVFGERFAELPDCVLIFSNPAASILHPRSIFPVSLPASQRWAVFRSEKFLTGNVVISQDGDIEVAFEPRYLGGKTVQAIIFRLRGNSTDVLAQYAAAAERPESDSCSGGRILTINGVEADCCGRIFFEFRGCAQPTKILNHCGVVLECPLSISEICPAERDLGAVADTTECAPTANPNGGGVSTSENQPDAPEYRL